MDAHKIRTLDVLRLRREAERELSDLAHRQLERRKVRDLRPARDRRAS